VRDDLPTGTVTFLFTDVEGSTRLLHELGAEAYAEALAEHRRIVREACGAHDGVEVDTQGDAFFFAFPTAPGALAAAATVTEALAAGTIQVRVGLHTGTPLLTEDGYIGPDVHKGARIAAAGHGGQVLVSTSTASLVDTQLTDLGEHRLKDLSAPERIHQLADGEFPPLKTLYRTNLPVPATPFLGRDAELAQVLELLTEDGVRLLTLTGPGGTGKTRLALQAAAAASDSFPDGVFWVPLAPLRDPELVLPTLAQALTVSEDPGIPLEDTLVAHLSGKTLLLLLDNVEHLLPPAAQRIAALRASNGSCLLVTSRERLRIGGEQTWPVPPLAEADGTALFLARARAVDPAFTESPAVDELCARLDELPLAIELAAARTAVFSAEQLLERLSQRLDLLKGDRDADPRQQTLRATIEWSHDLLAEDEQALFRRLAVFVGGCTYEAAEEVAGADPDTLQSLLDKSLLRKRDTEFGPRYWMLETIHEYAAEQLDETALARRHAEYYLALAEDAHPRMLRGDPKTWLDRLEAEHDNLRAALDRFAETREGELEQRLAAALWRFWQWRGNLTEGRRRLERALAADERRTEVRAWALFGAAVLAGDSADTAACTRWFEQALQLFEELGDAYAGARVRMNLGAIALQEGAPERTLTLSEDAVRAFEQFGDEDFVAVSTRNLAWAHQDLGDLERAGTLLEEVLRRARAIGNVHLEGEALNGLAELAAEEGRAEDALALLRESTRIFSELADPVWIAQSLSLLARVLVLSGRGETAAQVLARAEATFTELGVHRMVQVNPKTRTIILEQLDEAAYAEACARGEELTPNEAVALALGETVPDA
jgi:predicted ATPase/class 3 adenylate cyclase